MSIINHALKDKPVLVTGATGFIGGHLAQRLATGEQANVTGTGRKLNAVPFLNEIVTLQKADLLNHDEMAAAVAGKDIVFHVAAWLSTRTDQEAMARRLNADAVRELIRISAEAGVQRFILVSTIAVYGPPQKICMDEFTPIDPAQPDLYGKTKAMGEQQAIEAAAKHNIDLVIIRPGMVYGPRSYAWTVGMLKLVKKGLPTLFGSAEGHAFPIYIDNLCDMLILAATQPDAVGEAFNAVDAPVDWNQFFGYYGKMAGRKPRRVPMVLAQFVVFASKFLGIDVPIDRERLKFYQTKTLYPTKKAAAKLNYTPRVNINDGMAHSEQWLREAGHIK
ncbi:MAG: NAD-dependent epimerase/dehydratase family protein [Candidatus Promineifilaceae bacterium]